MWPNQRVDANVNVGMDEVKIAYQVWLGNTDGTGHVEDQSMMTLGLQK